MDLDFLEQLAKANDEITGEQALWLIAEVRRLRTEKASDVERAEKA